MKLRIEIDTADEKKAKAVASALSADAKTKRGTIKFEPRGEKIMIIIDSDDKVAMRAAVNSSLRIADACLSVLR